MQSKAAPDGWTFELMFLAEFHFVFHSGRKLANSNWLHFVLK